MNVMEIRGLCKAYPAFTLKDVSFTVPQGAVMGFIGRNGAGKSTTIKSVLGLVHPDAGQVEILGRSFSGGEKFIKENIGVVLGASTSTPRKQSPPLPTWSGGFTRTGTRKNTAIICSFSPLMRASGWISSPAECR